jgi:hypothetical protein
MILRWKPYCQFPFPGENVVGTNLLLMHVALDDENAFRNEGPLHPQHIKRHTWPNDAP